MNKNLLSCLTVIVFIGLSLLNTVGAIIAAIWLLLSGEWDVVGMGVVFTIAGPVVIGSLLTVGSLLASSLCGKNIYSLSLFSTHAVYQGVVLIGWCITTLVVSVILSKPSCIIPAAIWANAAGAGVLGYLARQDMKVGNDYSSVYAGMLSIGYFVSVLFILALGMPVIFSLFIFVFVYLIAFVLNLPTFMNELKLKNNN